MYSMIEPDVILPEQFGLNGSRGLNQPERRLMLAVLEDAIQTVMRHAGDQRPRPRKLVREVERWIEARDQVHVFSFANVCSMLDLDLDTVRRGVRKLIHQRETGRQQRARLGFARRMAGERHRVTVSRSHRLVASA